MDIFTARRKVAGVHLGLMDPGNQHIDTVRRVANGEADTNHALRSEFDALDMGELYEADLPNKKASIEAGMKAATGNPAAVDPPTAEPRRTNLEYVQYVFAEGV